MMPVTAPLAFFHGVGDLAHHADGAAAIDEADAVLGEDRAEVFCGLDIGRVGARPGAAVDADFADFAHFLRFAHGLHVHRGCGSVKTAAENSVWQG